MTVEEKMDQDLVAVGDETAMCEETDEEEDEDNDASGDPYGKRKPLKRLKQADNADGEDGKRGVRLIDQVEQEKESSGSDSDDPDSPKSKSSVLFMQLKDRKRALDDEAGSSNGGATDGGGSDPKRTKTSRSSTPVVGADSRATSPVVEPTPEPPAAPQEDRLDEATVRRLLTRRPHTTKELLNKLRPLCQEMAKHEIVACLADILRTLQPHQFRRTVNRKEVLFFSMSSP